MVIVDIWRGVMGVWARVPPGRGTAEMEGDVGGLSGLGLGKAWDDPVGRNHEPGRGMDDGVTS